MRKDHPGPVAVAADRGHRGRDLLRRRRSAATRPAGDARPAPADANYFSGSLQFSQPAHDRGEHHRRGPEDPLSGRPGRTAGPRGPAAGAGGTFTGVCPQLPARIQWRSAPAHRHCPGPGGESAIHRGRRAGVGARCVDSGADYQPTPGSAARPGVDVSLHRPRSERGAAHIRPGGGDVPGSPRGAGRTRAALRGPVSSLYPGAAVGRARARSAAAAPAHCFAGGCPEPGGRAAGVSLSPPLSGAPGYLQPDRSPTRGSGRWPQRGVFAPLS